MMQDIFYSYDQDTGEFVGEVERQPHPAIVSGPGHSTEIAPPDEQQGHARCFIDGAWTQIEDHRGEQWYEGPSQVTIDHLGPVPSHYSAEPVYETSDETLESTNTSPASAQT